MTKTKTLLSFLTAKKTSQEVDDLIEKKSEETSLSLTNAFNATPLDQNEESIIQNILEHYKNDEGETTNDLKNILTITSEIRAISNQAALLHGQRIKKAQQILRNYREGAFSAWLLAAYGNRQTPYNFLQYYDFCTSLPHQLREKLDRMPKQIVYILASRKGTLEEKETIVKNYNGQAKGEILEEIRKTFPLKENDLRAKTRSKTFLETIRKLHKQIASSNLNLNEEELLEFTHILEEIKTLLSK